MNGPAPSPAGSRRSTGRRAPGPPAPPGRQRHQAGAGGHARRGSRRPQAAASARPSAGTVVGVQPGERMLRPEVQRGRQRAGRQERQAAPPSQHQRGASRAAWRHRPPGRAPAGRARRSASAFGAAADSGAQRRASSASPSQPPRGGPWRAREPLTSASRAARPNLPEAQRHRGREQQGHRPQHQQHQRARAVRWQTSVRAAPASGRPSPTPAAPAPSGRAQAAAPAVLSASPCSDGTRAGQEVLRHLDRIRQHRAGSSHRRDHACGRGRTAAQHGNEQQRAQRQRSPAGWTMSSKRLRHGGHGSAATARPRLRRRPAPAAERVQAGVDDQRRTDASASGQAELRWRVRTGHASERLDDHQYHGGGEQQHRHLVEDAEPAVAAPVAPAARSCAAGSGTHGGSR